MTPEQLLLWLFVAALVVMLKSFRDRWVPENWRHELTNQVIGWIVLGVLGITVTVLWALVWKKPDETNPSVQAAPAPNATPSAVAVASLPKTEERIFVTASPRDLIEPFKRDTAYQAQQALQTFKGKWMRVQSEVVEVSPGTFERDGEMVVVGNQVLAKTKKGIPSSWVLLSMNFPREQANTVTHLRKGDAVTAECKIRDASDAGLLLNNCSLVK